MVITNELPRLQDASGAIVSRFLVLRLTKTWLGREDKKLRKKLTTQSELQGIVLWSIAGWQRLQQRGAFVAPASAAELHQEFSDLSSPIGAFLRDRCEVGAGFQVVVSDLFAAWVNWCNARKNKKIGDEGLFGRNLRAAIPNLSTRQERFGADRRRVFLGVKLR
jgi:putative DNA primase/helicase